MKKENLIDIVSNLKECEIARKGTNIFPYARIHCLYDNQPEPLWLTNDAVRYDNLKHPLNQHLCRTKIKTRHEITHN